MIINMNKHNMSQPLQYGNVLMLQLSLCLIIHVYVVTVYEFANATVHNCALL